MILNVTEYEYPGEDISTPDPEDSQLLIELLLDESRIDEAVILLESYSPTEIILDVSDSYFVKLRVAMEDTDLILGVDYERT